MNIKKAIVVAATGVMSMSAFAADFGEGVSAETEILITNGMQKAFACKSVEKCRDQWFDVVKLSGRMCDEMMVYSKKKAYLDGIRDTVKAMRKSGVIDEDTETKMLMSVAGGYFKNGIPANAFED